jgi:hypothetical protein
MRWCVSSPKCRHHQKTSGRLGRLASPTLAVLGRRSHPKMANGTGAGGPCMFLFAAPSHQCQCQCQCRSQCPSPCYPTIACFSRPSLSPSPQQMLISRSRPAAGCIVPTARPLRCKVNPPSNRLSVMPVMSLAVVSLPCPRRRQTSTHMMQMA